MEVAVGVVRTAEDYERIVPVRLNLKVKPHLTTYINISVTRRNQNLAGFGLGVVRTAEDYRGTSIILLPP